MPGTHSKLKRSVWVAPILLTAQMPQNPSPMAEHTRPHPRLTQLTPVGILHQLEIGTLYIPPKLNSKRALLVFFHGGKWLPEVAGAKYRIAVISVQAGAGSGTYARAFADRGRFPNLRAEAEKKANLGCGKHML